MKKEKIGYVKNVVKLFKMIDLQKNYKDKVIPFFKKEYKYKNPMQIPKIVYVSFNSGLGKIAKSASNGKDFIKIVKDDISKIVGQAPVIIKAKESIAGFNLHKNDIVGVKATLRGKNMIDFLERLVNIALPRVRDFGGISDKSFDNHGNLNIGIKEFTIFPELGIGKEGEKARKNLGIQVNIITNANSKEEGIALFKQLGFPLTMK